MKLKVRKYGGSLSVPLTPYFRTLEIKEGDIVEASLVNRGIMIKKEVEK